MPARKFVSQKNLTSRCCQYLFQSVLVRGKSMESKTKLDDECLNFLSELDINSVTLLIKFLSFFLLGFIEAKLWFFFLERIYILNFFSLYDSPNLNPKLNKYYIKIISILIFNNFKIYIEKSHSLPIYLIIKLIRNFAFPLRLIK